MGGFFGRVSRYARQAAVDQREDRLTGVFAAVLERCDGLALALARDWLRPRQGDGEGPSARSWSLTHQALSVEGLTLRLPVRTWRPTRSGKFVDMELRFGLPDAVPAQDVVVWVEAKHGTAPHEHQLESYVEDLQSVTAQTGAVVLLAPRRSYPFNDPSQPPPEVPQRTWEAVTDLCRRSRSDSGEVASFLINEFIDYLQEERLVDPNVLSPLHFLALAEYGTASSGIALATQLASAYIEEHWDTCWEQKLARGKKPDWGIGYWATHPSAKRGDQAADWDAAWFDWNLKDDDWAMPDNRGGIPVFMAGVSAEPSDGVIHGPNGAAWLARLQEQHGFVELHDDKHRVARFAYPEEVLVGRDLSKQAESLGRWVVDTYAALYEAGPPPAGR